MYINNQPSLSTASPEILISKSGFDTKMNIPSIGLKQLCERYYFKKPMFLNLDVEGLGGYALKQNDWENPKCRPEMILAEENALNDKALGNMSIQQFLEKHGY